MFFARSGKNLFAQPAWRLLPFYHMKTRPASAPPGARARAGHASPARGVGHPNSTRGQGETHCTLTVFDYAKLRGAAPGDARAAPPRALAARAIP